MAQQVIRPSDIDPGGLGPVPTLGGAISTAVPDPLTGVSATQAQQSSTTATQNIGQAIVIPPAPYAVINSLDPSGSLGIWFQTLIRKLGGYTSNPTQDALVLQDYAETVDQSSRDAISALQQNFTSQSSAQPTPTIQDLFNDQRQGQWVDQLNPILTKAQGKGIKVDFLTPTFGWRDMKGAIDLRTGGATVPTRAVYQGSLYAVSFDHATLAQEVFTEYHFDHDYVMATDIYIHTHWSTIVAATGNVNWLFDLSYAKGYNQGALEGTVGSSLPVTVGITQAGGSAFYHQIAEVVMSAAGGLISSAINVSITAAAATLTAASALFTAADIGKTIRVVGAGAAGGNLDVTITAYASTTSVTVSAVAGTTVTTQPNFKWRVLDSNLFEPDGIILCRTWHQTNRTADTLTQIPFLHYVDCHYQSTNIGTKQKNGPAFWT